jgi:hypothetical protein
MGAAAATGAATQWVAAVGSTLAAVADALEAAAVAAVADADVAVSGGEAAAAVYRGARASSARTPGLDQVSLTVQGVCLC